MLKLFNTYYKDTRNNRKYNIEMCNVCTIGYILKFKKFEYLQVKKHLFRKIQLHKTKLPILKTFTLVPIHI